MKHCPPCDIFTRDIELQCPKCGGELAEMVPTATRPDPKPDPNKPDVAAGCFVLIGILVVVGYFGGWFSGGAAKSPATAACLILSDHAATAGGYIVGRVVNRCGTSYRYVEIEFKLLDKSGAVVGTAMSNVTALGGQETWSFKAPALREFSRYELVHLKGD
jgi:hypothetical protein